MPMPSSALCSPKRTGLPSPLKTQCRPIGSAGSISSGSSNSAIAMYRRLPAASKCTVAPCSGSSPSTRRGVEAHQPPGVLGNSEFVGVDNHRLIARRAGPFLHRRQLHNRVTINLSGTFELDLVCSEAGYDGRERCVRDTEMPEQKVALAVAEALTAIAPDRHYAVDVRLNLRGDPTIGEARSYIH